MHLNIVMKKSVIMDIDLCMKVINYMFKKRKFITTKKIFNKDHQYAITLRGFWNIT